MLGPPFGPLWEHFGGLGGVLGCNFGHFGSFLMICGVFFDLFDICGWIGV